MPRRAFTSAQVLTILEENPPRIAALTASLTPAQLHTPPHLDAWSANDVLAHLRACADLWGNCINGATAFKMIIAHDTPTIRAVNPTSWINDTDYRAQDFQPSFHAFAMQRTALLAVLEPLTPDGWARAATVTGAGRPLERTVLEYAQWLAGHDQRLVHVHPRSSIRPAPDALNQVAIQHGSQFTVDDQAHMYYGIHTDSIVRFTLDEHGTTQIVEQYNRAV